MWAASCLASCACEACRSVAGSIGRRSARIAYCGLFALSLFLSFLLRQIAAPLMQKMPWINHFHKTPNREWFETDAVLRVSLGNFLFFTMLAVLMLGIKDQKDPRDRLHHGGWMAKIFCWCVVVILMFFVPNGLVSFYEMISKFGSGLFLLVQVVLLLDFVHGWNDNWVNGSLLPASVISLYCTYLCYSGLSSEPRDYECNGLHKHAEAVSTGSPTIGLATTVLSVVYSAVRAGSSTTLLSPPSSPRAGSQKPLLPFDKVEEQEDRKKDKASLVPLFLLPPNFLSCQHVLGDAFNGMVDFGWRERQAC